MVHYDGLIFCAIGCSSKGKASHAFADNNLLWEVLIMKFRHQSLFGIYDKGKLVDVIYASDQTHAIKKAAMIYRARTTDNDFIYLEANTYKIMRVV